MSTNNARFWSSPVLKRGLLIGLIPVIFGALGGVSASKFKEGQRDAEFTMMKEDVKALNETKANKSDIEYIKEAIDQIRADNRDIRKGQDDVKELLIKHIDK